MNKKKKYIFFIRDYNDWDNIAPIIFYLAKTSEEKIFICFYKKDLRFSDQFKYLNKVVGHKLHVLYWSATKFSVFFNLTIKILNKIFKILNLEKKISYNTRVSNDELKKWIDKIKNKEKTCLIFIFDRMLDPILGYIRDQLKDLETIFISCPHAPETNVNRMKYTKQMKRIRKNIDLEKYLKSYEYLIFTDRLELELSEKFSSPQKNDILIDNSKIKVLGSIRYCKEWLKHVDIFTNKIVKSKTDKIKIVFFMKKFVHNVFKDEVYRTIELFASFPNIDFYIKPHTRGMIFSSKIKAPNVHIEYDSTSSFLINMADVVFFYGGTSIILEAITKKKLTVCLDYLDANINVYEYFNACQILKCRDDLCFFLNSDIQKKIENNMFSGEKVLQEIVYNRDNSTPIPSRYTSFFENL